MARSITVAEIIRRALRAADMENTAFIDDGTNGNGNEQLELLNEAYSELYDLLVAANENYYHVKDTFALVSGTHEYSLPADFYKLIGVDYEINANGKDFITIKPFMESERNGAIGTVNSLPQGNIRLRYVPAPTIFTATTETIDGIAGWEGLITTTMAIMMLDKEESNTTALNRRKNMYLKRIEEMKINRDQGAPGRITDIHSTEVLRQYAALRYRLYGDNIEFISTEIVSPEAFGSML